MSSINLNKLSITIFGESHGEMVGGVITGIEPGLKLNFDKLKKEMDRRKPGQNALSTLRKEDDEVNIVSGVLNGITTGAPICVLIKNADVRSNDYASHNNIPRPSHSDYAAKIKYNGFNDVRGGGHFSGRLTAPLLALGSICKQALENKNIEILAHLYNISDCFDKSFSECEIEEMEGLKNTSFPVIDTEKEKKMKEIILNARENSDSVGGVVECAVLNMPAGIGGPLFYGIEGHLSKLLFAIPAVKGVDFGLGFEFGKSMGSKVNDEYYIKDGKVCLKSNNCGGILGGISSGEPIILKAAFKPTPSIFKVQDSVNLDTMENTKVSIKGRHDPCIALRAVPVVESVVAIGILDLLGG